MNMYMIMEDEFLVLMHDDGKIDDEEFFIRYEANRHRNLHGGLPYDKYERFNSEGLCDDECEVECRFKRQDIYCLAAALNLPDTVWCQNGALVEPIQVLCICVTRYTYPCRYADLVPRFGRSVCHIYA